MKTLLLVAILATPLFSQTISYDKFKEQTSVISDSRFVSAQLSLTVWAMYAGQRKSNVACFLVFRSGGRNWRFLEAHDLTFLADGQRMPLGSGRHEGQVISTRVASGVREAMTYPIPCDDLAKLANASSLEMKLGYAEVRLGEKDKQPIRSIVDYLK